MNMKSTYYSSEELRNLFVSYFESVNHQKIESSSLIPENDPTLLFTTAGMVQMKPYFVGDITPLNPKMVSVQKCLRTTDIDEVGDTTHLTFFEMLGNFSVGDYFKPEAINFAWEFITNVLKLDESRIWVSVYLDDDEAVDLWNGMGIPKSKIKRFDESDNFWGPAGDSGPCGPCSEIHYDLTPDVPFHDSSCGPNCPCGRFVEIWNLVFMEFNQDQNGNRTKLKNPNIDTGMGLERLAAIMQGVDTVYDTDIFLPIIEAISKFTNIDYGSGSKFDKSIRTIAEHVRASVFIMSDGVNPGNEGHGYVLRRLIRRAIRASTMLGSSDSLLIDTSEIIFDVMGSIYPELIKSKEHIQATLKSEQDQFDKTLKLGSVLMEKVVSDTLKGPKRIISGNDVFRLYDTYGLPIEISTEIATSNDLSINMKEYDEALEAQRSRGRSDKSFLSVERVSNTYKDMSTLSTDFIGYRSFSSDTHITGLIVAGGISESAGTNQMVEVITKDTPFYAESGGQIGDIGIIQNQSGGIIEIRDVQKPISESPEFTVHIGVVTNGKFSVGDQINMNIDLEHREQTTRHHTATHLLHNGLRNILGNHVKQAGSLVANDHLRFDFSHTTSIDKTLLDEVVTNVNSNIMRNILVETNVLPIREALDTGALAFFGDKYGDLVRTVSIVPDSTDKNYMPSYELCGGTHVSSTGEIGFTYVVGEGSIGSGMRRIEAVAGIAAHQFIENKMSILNSVAARLQVTPDSIQSRIESHLGELVDSNKAIIEISREYVLSQLDSLITNSINLDNESKVIIGTIQGATTNDTLLELIDKLRSSIKSGVFIIGAVINNKPSFVCAVTKDLVGKGEPFHAVRLIKQIASIVDGGGGGKPELATAGGKNIANMDKALDVARQIFRDI